MADLRTPEQGTAKLLTDHNGTISAAATEEECILQTQAVLEYRSTVQDHDPRDSPACVSNNVNLNDLLRVIGIGKAQYVYWAILSLIVCMDVAEMVLISTIVPLLRCEFDMNLKWETAIIVSSFGFSAISGALLGKLSDIYGRRRMLAISVLCEFIAAVGSALTQTKVQFFILRSIVGICMGITFSTSLIFSAEVVENSSRETGPGLINMSCASAELIVATLSYLILPTIGWRWFVIVCAAPLLPCFFLITFVTPESPRYLLVSGRKERARDTLMWMAEKNGVEILGRETEITVDQDQDLGQVSQLFTAVFRKETILLSMIAFGSLMSIFSSILFVPLVLYSDFCGVVEGSPDHDSCVFVSKTALLQLMLVTLGAILGIIVGYVSVKKLGRTLSLKLLSALNLFSILFLYKCFSQMGTVVTLCFVKLFGIATIMCWLIIVPELYPTSIRTVAMGFINSSGKFGGAIGAALVYVLFYISPYYVLGLLTGAAVLVLVCALIYNKETKDSVLHDVLDTDSR